ncbi:amino acid ABC transporter permease [Streptomyces sp. SID13666]|uniref:amino acid ABC transporter permease n=1 Tax=unclassified Streptomyces TaxID=2593676 RepID=UPI0013C09880|nr:MULTISPECIES: amino acid ABC transporter permease [unclassified Streptomyces]NEA56556.1 amino acid ABC transporter permease [Streptomyces sp. SID13666]NEA72350.1 amino acid ABC transporter permease [Streptomyces sp. SID13588]
MHTHAEEQQVNSSPRPESIRAVAVRHPGRWAAVGAVGVLLAMLGHAIVTNPKLQWHRVWDILWDPTVLMGLQTTLLLTVLAMVIGSIGGLFLTVMRLSHNPLLSGPAWLFIWVFRGTPVLVQLFIWNFLGALWPRISIGIPFGPEFHSWAYNDLVSLPTAAVLCLGLNEAAYMAEIVRAGILSVGEGQSDAAASLGMTRRQTMRRIMLPQAMRVIVPPTGNEAIAMLKITSLVSAISLVDVTRAGQDIASRTFENMPALIAVSIWYLAFTSLLMIGQYFIERRYGRGTSRLIPAKAA